jgi:hypothetical protein
MLAERVDRNMTRLAELLTQLCRRRRVILAEERDGKRVLEVQLDADLPAEAYRQLSEQLPKPSGLRLTWDTKRQRWCDPFNRADQ